MADIYTILEQALEDKVPLGTGSFGNVYKATWSRQSVAVKYFNQRPIGDDQNSKREIEVLTHLEALQHPNIIRIYGMGVSGPQMFMVMELAPFALDHILHKCKDEYDYSIDHVISWSLQLAKALECCHQNGVIHRDIKPSNILLFDNGVNLKICDFGTAKKLEATFAHTFIGTPYYLAPEIISGVKYCSITQMFEIFHYSRWRSYIHM
jgi:serine/threonine protein kinase